MKVKEISIGRGRKYSNNYQSVDYHVGITVEGEEAPDKLKKYANAILLEMESHEDIRCKLIIEGIKAEQIKEFKKTYNNVTKKLADNIMKADPQFTKETLEIDEEVLMDLTEVTVMVITDKAVLFTKKGYQKWVPLSTIEDGVPLKEGKYLEDIELTDQGAKWIPNKSWEPLKVVKK